MRQFLILTPNAQLLAGRQYRLSMAFTSILNNELRGFYRSSYNENATTKYMAVSQMQPTDARRAFPCFDEPNMKANFTMKLGRLTTQLSTSNMPVKETTPMSVAIYFFIITVTSFGEFQSTLPDFAERIDLATFGIFSKHRCLFRLTWWE